MLTLWSVTGSATCVSRSGTAQQECVFGAAPGLPRPVGGKNIVLVPDLKLRVEWGPQTMNVVAWS